jgi:adenosylhomocysteine nucleosidase
LAPDRHLLVAMALPLESGGALEHCGAGVLYTGVGKLNAAYALTRELVQRALRKDRELSLVLNLGTAGSSVFPAGTLVECTRFVQRDMDASPLGFAVGETPYDAQPPVLSGQAMFPHLAQATCGTGDDFCLDYDARAFQVVDMEAYALAKVCRLECVAFACVKYITDGAQDDASAAQWQQTAHTAGEQLAVLLRGIADDPRSDWRARLDSNQ